MSISKKSQFSNPQHGAALTVHVSGGASQNEIVKMDEGKLRVRLAVPAGDKSINQVLVKLLAERLMIPPATIEIVAGQAGSDKLVAIVGISAADLQSRLEKLVSA